MKKTTVVETKHALHVSMRDIMKLAHASGMPDDATHIAFQMWDFRAQGRQPDRNDEDVFVFHWTTYEAPKP